MLEGLFGEDESAGDSGGVFAGGAAGCGDAPPPPRLPCGLAGINNQGATCYLNSLLQTLLFTPEFRDNLFCLGENELGSLDQVGQTGAKVRVIPIQLQRLFARLLLSDQQSVSTTELTDSFGWTNNEAVQQQDVQELNRILFSAIEDSLVGTAGQDFIADLYHGSIVNQITCQECHRVSEREEDFLDLTLTVAGNGSVQDVLADSYCNTEMMDGRNQYRCERCNKLVNAKKGAQLRSLPTILTLSLLRFSFDFQKMERYKESGRMTFPLILDMSPYVEKNESCDSSLYELFSVVIHGGGAYGGHYHAYIRDVDSFGNWTHPDEEEIRLPIDPSTGSVDYLEVDSPVDMVTALLSRAGKQGLSMDKLCSEMTKQTGVSWNKRFKKHYGPINKFLKKYEEHFEFDQTTNWVNLKTSASGCKKTGKDNSPCHKELNGDSSQLEVNSSSQSSLSETSQPHVKLKENPKRPVSPAPAPGYCWFDFDDSHVHPIREKEIEKQFSGKASAYMLFYRRVSMKGSPIRERRNIPENLVSMVIAENEELHLKRKKYEEAFNTVTVQVHLGSRYEYRMGALHPQDSSFYFIEVTLDRRKTLFELTQCIHETGEIIPNTFTLHRLKTLPSGGHLYEEISLDDGNMTCKDCGISNGDQLFLWDGQTVLGEVVPTGSDCEPICLTVIYGNPHQVTRGFPKNLSLAEFKVIIGDLLQLETCDLGIQRLVSEGIGVKAVEIKSQEMDVTLESLKLKDGDELVVSPRGSQGSSYPDVLKSLSNSHNTSQFSIENRCIKMSVDCSWPVFSVEVDKDATVGELKLTALSKAGVGEVSEGGRLRVDHSTLGLKPPLYEGLTLTAAHLAPGTRLVLEPGAAPLNNEMTLTFETAELKDESSYMELTIDKSLPVGMCLSLMIDKAGFTGDAWHLRKTNWCGEASDVLDDMEISVEEATLHHGDHVLLEPGKLPPKGVLRLAVSLYPSPHSALTGADNSTGMLNWITQGIQGLLGGPSSPAGDTSPSPMILQDVEISKEATLEDLKLQVMTLPEVAALPIPTPDFLRLRLVDRGRLSTVLKGSTFTLQRLKLKSDSHIAVQALPWEEKLTQNHLVLWVQQRLPEVRGYGPAVEIVWDASQGPSAANLRTLISELCQIPKHRLTIAKHFQDKFEWLVLHDINKKPGSKKGKKKFLAPKSNMKNSPYFLKDGDVIGVKDLDQDVDKEDFGTEEDDQGKQRLSQEANEKQQQRQEKKRMQTAERVCTVKRPEVGLHIKVDKFT